MPLGSGLRRWQLELPEHRAPLRWRGLEARRQRLFGCAWWKLSGAAIRAVRSTPQRARELLLHLQECGGIICSMKVITDSGQPLILRRNVTFGGGRHDPFPSHAVLYGGMIWSLCGSGRYVSHIRWTLEDGVAYYYPLAYFPTWQAADAWFYSHLTYRAPSGAVGYLGEWYNFVARPLTFDKVPLADWVAWLAAH